MEFYYIILTKNYKMKTIVNILKNVVRLTVLCSMMVLVSCKDDLENEASISISMTAIPRNGARFSMAGSGTITIDWRDGTVETKNLLNGSNDYDQNWHLNIMHVFDHLYTDFSEKTIKVKGNNITHFAPCFDMTSFDMSGITTLKWLYCRNRQLTELDVSKNPALIGLDCSENRLKNLDLSKNTVLKYLDCSSNDLSADSLNALFGTLHGNNIDLK